MEVSKIRSALAGLKQKVQELDAAITRKERDISELVSLPLPYDDFLAWSLERFDHKAEAFPDQFSRFFLAGNEASLKSFYMSKRPGHTARKDFESTFNRPMPMAIERPSSTGFGTEFPITEHAFFYIFREQIQDAMRSVFDNELKPKWPKEVGPDRVTRMAKLETMEAELEAMVSEREAIAADISSITQ